MGKSLKNQVFRVSILGDLGGKIYACNKYSCGGVNFAGLTRYEPFRRTPFVDRCAANAVQQNTKGGEFKYEVQQR
jgi:hypothetical protein